MSIVLTDDTYYQDIANAIRSKNGTTTQYKPSEMAAAINAISTGGGGYNVSIGATDSDIYNLYYYSLNGTSYEKVLLTNSNNTITINTQNIPYTSYNSSKKYTYTSGGYTSRAFATRYKWLYNASSWWFESYRLNFFFDDILFANNTKYYNSYYFVINNSSTSSSSKLKCTILYDTGLTSEIDIDSPIIDNRISGMYHYSTYLGNSSKGSTFYAAVPSTFTSDSNSNNTKILLYMSEGVDDNGDYTDNSRRLSIIVDSPTFTSETVSTISSITVTMPIYVMKYLSISK